MKELDQPDVLRFKPQIVALFFRAQMLYFPTYLSSFCGCIVASALGLVFLAFQLLELVTVGVFLTFANNHWIGWRKILTGNHGFSHEI